MQATTFSTEFCHRFKSFFRSRRADPRSDAGSRERSELPRRVWDEDERVASCGAANLIHLRDGRWEHRGGSLVEPAAAREWAAPFQREASYPLRPALVMAEKSQGSIAVHNRILIADDDNNVRDSLAAVLESEGYVVAAAENGIKAVARAIEHKPDLVLLDLNMPHWDGWTAFSQLDRVTPLLPVIVITARPNQYQKAVQLGVDAFMEKPLNSSILLRACKNHSTEDEKRHVSRITNRAFVTQLLPESES